MSHTPAKVILFSNGMLMVFDSAGQQIAELQGHYIDKLEAALAVSDKSTLFQVADWTGGTADTLPHSLKQMLVRSQQLKDALKLVLLFHRGGEWTNADVMEWQRITGSTDATSKVMCDHIRKCLEVR